MLKRIPSPLEVSEALVAAIGEDSMSQISTHCRCSLQILELLGLYVYNFKGSYAETQKSCASSD